MEKVFVFLIVVALAVALQPAAGGGLDRRKSSTNDIFLDTTRGDESPRGRSKSKERPRSSSPSKGKRSRSRSKSRNRDVDIPIVSPTPIVSRTDTLIAPTRRVLIRLHGDPDLWKETVTETIRTFRDLEEEGRVGTPERFSGYPTLRQKFPQLITRVYQAKRGDCRIQQILNLPKSDYGDDSKSVHRFQDRQPTEMKDCMSFLKETRHNIEPDELQTSLFEFDDENDDDEDKKRRRVLYYNDDYDIDDIDEDYSVDTPLDSPTYEGKIGGM